MVFIVLIMGLLIGSFLNVCIYRIPKGESIAFPPSHCTSCGNKIKNYDLIPVFSWIFLRGKCRFCEEKISMRYSIVELFTAIIYVVLFLQFGLTMEFFKLAILISFLIVIGLIDHDTTDVYTATTWIPIFIGAVFLVYNVCTGQDYATYIYGFLACGGIIAFIVILTHGMGWGDAEICALCGMFLGIEKGLLMMLLSFLIGGTIAAYLIISKRKNRKDYIAFGPYIVIAAIISSIWGNSIIDCYIRVFF
ncbi:MAG: prepilin peptidase [Clostridium sp.]